MKQTAVRVAQKLARRKRRIEKRLAVARETRFLRMSSCAPPVLSSAGLKYELADKAQAIVYGGAPLMLRVARENFKNIVYQCLYDTENVVHDAATGLYRVKR